MCPIAGVGVIAVGITNNIHEEFLAAISGSAGTTQGQQQLGVDYFKAADFTALDSVMESVSRGVCKRPIQSEDYFLKWIVESETPK